MMKNKYYHIFANTVCPFCVRAINLLNESETEYVLTLIDNSPNYLENLKKEHEWETIPIIFECNNDTKEKKLIGGYTDLMDYFLTPKEVEHEDAVEIAQ
jgi:glutaredoxin